MGEYEDEACAMCLEDPRDPRVVPCGNRHVFCLQCLQRLATHGGDNVGRPFPCPLCRNTVVIPPGGVESFESTVNRKGAARDGVALPPARPVEQPQRRTRSEVSVLEPQRTAPMEQQQRPCPEQQRATTSMEQQQRTRRHLCIRERQQQPMGEWLAEQMLTFQRQESIEQRRALELVRKLDRQQLAEEKRQRKLQRKEERQSRKLARKLEWQQRIEQKIERKLERMDEKRAQKLARMFERHLSIPEERARRN